MADHEITTATDDDVDVNVPEELGGKTTVAGDGSHATDDAAEAAWVSERAKLAGADPTIVTTYEDGEPAATSIHTGARKDPEEQPEAFETKASAKSAAKSKE